MEATTELPSTLALLRNLLLGIWFFYLLYYLFFAYCLQVMAKKTNTPDRWMAWIPVFQIYLMCKIAKRPGWWFLLCFLPVISLVIFIILLVDIAKALGKPEWVGVLVILPIIGIFAWGYLAFAKGKTL